MHYLVAMAEKSLVADISQNMGSVAQAGKSGLQNVLPNAVS